MRTRLVLCVALVVMVCGLRPVRAEDKTEVGGPAPKLSIAEFAKGDPVGGFETGKVYVVEFWATWCGPCVANIPHLSELQAHFKNKVTVIGVSQEPAGTVKPFVAKQGARMAYTVAVDKNNETNKAYMEAFGVEGIPHAFVVNGDGVLVWHGHPQAGLPQALEDVLSGKLDAATARKMEGERIEQEKAAKLAEPALNKYFQLVTADAADAKALESAGQEVLRALDVAKNAEFYNNIAWELLTNEQVKHRDKALALQLAERANKASEGKQPHILDTFARALHDTGKLKEAIEQQKKAVELSGDNPGLKAELSQTLQGYESEVKK